MVDERLTVGMFGAVLSSCSDASPGSCVWFAATYSVSLAVTVHQLFHYSLSCVAVCTERTEKGI